MYYNFFLLKMNLKNHTHLILRSHTPFTLNMAHKKEKTIPITLSVLAYTINGNMLYGQHSLVINALKSIESPLKVCCFFFKSDLFLRGGIPHFNRDLHTENTEEGKMVNYQYTEG